MDSVRSGPYGQIFRPDNFVFGQVCQLNKSSGKCIRCFKQLSQMLCCVADLWQVS